MTESTQESFKNEEPSKNEKSRQRDDRGRFIKQTEFEKENQDLKETLAKGLDLEEEKPVVKEEVKQEISDQETQTQERRDYRSQPKFRYADKSLKPQSWRTPEKQNFEKIREYVLNPEETPPPDKELLTEVLETVLRREQETQRAFQEHAGILSQHRQTMFDAELEAKKLNISPKEYINGLNEIHTTLSYGTPTIKAEFIKSLCKLYNVNMTPDGVLQTPQIDSQVEQQLYNNQQQVREYERKEYLQNQEIADKIINELNDIRNNPEDYPHYERLKPQIFELGKKHNLTSAYEAYQMALKEDPSINEANELLELKRQIAQERREKEELLAKYNKSNLSKTSLKSSAPIITEQQIDYNKPESLKDQLRSLL